MSDDPHAPTAAGRITHPDEMGGEQFRWGLNSAATEVDVVMPAFNAGAFVGEAIGSVLRQSFAAWELWLLDDGSTDGTRAVANEYASRDPRIHVLSHATNAGIPASLNDAISAGCAPFVTFLGADDRWTAAFLSSQFRALKRDPGAVAVAADAWIIDASGQRSGKLWSALQPPPPGPSYGTTFEVLRENHVCSVAVVWSRARAAGLTFNRAIPCMNDWLFWLELSRRGRILYNPEPLAEYRLHGSNMNVGFRRRDDELVDFVAEFRKVFGSVPRAVEHRLQYYLVRGHERRGEQVEAVRALARMFALDPACPKNVSALTHFLPLEERMPRIPHLLGGRFVHTMR